MNSSIVSRLMVCVVVGAVSLFLLACSSQSPVGTIASASLSAESVADPVTVAETVIDPKAGIESSDSNGSFLTTIETGAPQSPGQVASVNDPELSSVGSTESGPALALVSTPSTPSNPWTNSAQDVKGNGFATGIVVSGSGRATSAPDHAALNLGVEATEVTVSEARSAAATSLTAIIDSVKEDGVAEEDIQTGRYSIQPRYTGREVTRCIESESADTETTTEATQEGPDIESKGQDCFQEYQSVITGYQVNNNITVKVRDLDTVDDVIDGAVEAGGNFIRFNGLSFSLENTSELESQARAAAVANLQAKAGELATLSGVVLQDLVYLTEIGDTPPDLFRPEYAMSRAAADYGASVSTPIAPGEISVNVKVLGHFAISQPAE